MIRPDFPNRTYWRALVLAAILLALGHTLVAQNAPAPPPPATQSAQTAPSGTAQQPQAHGALRVARISLIEGEVSYQRGNDTAPTNPQANSSANNSANNLAGQSNAAPSNQNLVNSNWFDATINTALEDRDQVFTGRNGRTELQFNGRTLVRLDRETNLRLREFSTSAIQLAQAIGTATYRVDNLDRRQFDVYDVRSGSIDDPLYFEIATPTVAVTLLKEGVYRINVRDDGTTEVIVRKGQAEVYNQQIGSVPVKSGRRIIIEGRDPDYYQIAKLNDKDDWDRWNERRDDDFFARDTYRSSRYVPATIAGAYDLDAYGDWMDTPEYGYVWVPRGVAAGWAPYRSGYWRYHGRWGWTWTSYEPWGWAPYHYGRWTYWRSRWCWTPFVNFGVGRVGVGFWGWSPHLVAFFGWGNSYNRGYRDGYYDGIRDASWGGWTGWCPLGFGERWGGGYYDRRYYGGGRNVVNNYTTIINNNTTVVRSIDSLRNYHAPGAVSGVEGRRFNNNRVVAENLTPLPGTMVNGNPSGRGGGGRTVITDGAPNAPGVVSTTTTITPTGRTAGGRTIDFVQPDDFKPTQTEVARTFPVERNSAAGRALTSNVVSRGALPRTMERAGSSGDGQPERNLPTRASSSSVETNRVNGNGTTIERSGAERTLESAPRDRRSPVEYRPVERVERPTVTRPASEDPRGRDLPTRGTSGSSSGGWTVPPDRKQPVERTMPTERRVERQIERQPAVPPREVSPRREPMEQRRESPPREYRRETAPPRESAPPPRAPERMERPASPPPQREAPPSRETAPARPERPAGDGGRSLPSRKSGPDLEHYF